MLRFVRETEGVEHFAFTLGVERSAPGVEDLARTIDQDEGRRHVDAEFVQVNSCNRLDRELFLLRVTLDQTCVPIDKRSDDVELTRIFLPAFRQPVIER